MLSTPDVERGFHSEVRGFHARRPMSSAKLACGGRPLKRKTTEPVPIGERLLTIREAAEILRLHPRTVREYVRRGEIEGRIIGGRYRFRRCDLDAFFENAPRTWDFTGKDGDGD